MRFNQNKRSFSLMLTTCLLAMGSVAVMSGCQATRSASTLKMEYEADDAFAEIDFWQDLADRPVATNNEAFHGLIEFIDGHDKSENFAQRVTLLQDKGYLSKSFDQPSDQAVQRGTIARILCSYLEIKGGLSMRLLGPNPRYATRELMHLNIFPPSSPQQGLSGIEFVGIVSRAEAYQEKRQ